MNFDDLKKPAAVLTISFAALASGCETVKGMQEDLSAVRDRAGNLMQQSGTALQETFGTAGTRNTASGEIPIPQSKPEQNSTTPVRTLTPDR